MITEIVITKLIYILQVFYNVYNISIDYIYQLIKISKDSKFKMSIHYQLILKVVFGL